MIDAATFNAPNWVDLSTPAVDSAREFYSELFDWDMTTMPSTMGDYHVATVRSQEVAGMMEQGPHMAGAPAMWTTFLYVESMEATVAKVVEAGGRVMQPPFEIPGGALVSVIVDPTGAMIALIAGGEIPEGTYFSTRPGAVCWVELLTRDPEAAKTFYRDVFGWTAETGVYGGTEYTMFKLGDDMVAGMIMMPEMVPNEVPAVWSVYFAVDDCDAAVKMAAELGGQVIRNPTEINMGRFAVLADPHGATFDIIEYAE